MHTTAIRSPRFWHCATSQLSVAAHWRLVGYFSCMSSDAVASSEVSCRPDQTKCTQNGRIGCYSAEGPESGDEYSCDNRFGCGTKCNGISECMDSSDERDCGTYTLV